MELFGKLKNKNEPLKEKMFEDYFTEIQSDMVSICLEYVENKADEIYIYTSFESNVATSNYFYNIGGNILKKHNLNNANNGFNYDVSLERQRDCLQILIDDIKQLVEVCKKYGRPMPTEIKMVYDVKTKQFNADYKYNLVHSNHKTKTAEAILERTAPRNSGSDLDEIEEGQPYFGTIMRYGSDKFDDSLEIFKAAKQGQEQEKYQ